MKEQPEKVLIGMENWNVTVWKMSNKKLKREDAGGVQIPAGINQTAR